MNVSEMKMVAIPFNYKNVECFSLVRIKHRSEGVKLEVTIMNGNLERVFYGHHTFKLDCGCVKSDAEPVDKDVRELHSEIKSALEIFAQRHMSQAI